MVNKPLIRPYFWGGTLGGGTLTSHEEDVGKDAGMKAVVSLPKLNNRIKRRPLRIVQEFERDLLRELGVVEGQAWSVKDWLKKQQWGNSRDFSGLASRRRRRPKNFSVFWLEEIGRALGCYAPWKIL